MEMTYKTKGVIGRMIRPGTTPGGFSSTLPVSRGEHDRARAKLKLGEQHQQIKDAASRVLEKRPEVTL